MNRHNFILNYKKISHIFCSECMIMEDCKCFYFEGLLIPVQTISTWKERQEWRKTNEKLF